ncbi:glycoside hydrolase family 5 protein [Cellulophaga baltica]|uniref:cellulase family glycosylhydrolase n=1 Tax=Cellulophaga TaxID=104264 RepID=UPI001C075F09|nr:MULTISPECIES: cellulase family glycosylhydrolase [Cellulophaga]MBU2996684.1 glycoside hydrolase family 5 protein [Cellulophaga baltica]MDO6768078.1 cellulase family glycosylhydrolase [Cellulophaga sp. 1_MG-2023]
MAARINRNIYRGILILSFLAVNGLILFGISSVLSYLNTGADRTSMLHLEVEREDVYLPNVTWEDLQNPGRPLEKQTQGEIERDYLSSWYVKNIAYKTNDYYGVKDYYTDSARVKVYKTIDYNLAHNINLNTTTLSHNLSLDFYSADGKLAVVEDKNVVSFKEVFEADKMVLQERDTSSYKAILLLEDGFWRIRHLKKIINDTVAAQEKVAIDYSNIKNAKGLNYYPKDSPWNMFGKKFNPFTIHLDFELIKKMGMNTIRIFVPYEAFGKASIDYEKLDQLKRILDIANKNGLKVVVTLFDFYGNYDVSDWTITNKHATIIVNALKNNKALLAWDIKNEPDLDFKSRSSTTVVNWLKQMIVTIKNEDVNHPVTIGWSSPEAATLLVNELDFVSFHYYKKISDFEKDYNKLTVKSQGKPIMLQEYGLSSYSGLWNFYKGSEVDQADYYKEIQPILLKNNIPFLAWTLYDFKEVPSEVAGSLPWRKNKQHNFGFFDINGKEKSSYNYFSLQKNKKGE